MTTDRRTERVLGSSRVVTALEASVVARLLRRGIDATTARSTYSGVLESWYRWSTLARSADRVRTIGERAAVVAASVRAARAVATWVAGSLLYRWLATEPEPDVVVIDLRETWTVGPPLALLERITVAVTPAARRSSLARAASSVGARVDDAPVRAASLVVLAATAADTLATAATGHLTDAGVALRVGLAALAALGTRSTLSLDDLRETRTWRFVRSILEPPPPEESSDHD